MTLFNNCNFIGMNKYPKSSDDIEYGTAGFRTKAEDLKHVMFRMGLLAVIRSRVKSAAIGVMITASHNPESDNGVKLVDPHGEMLQQEWEVIATELANAEDSQLETNLKNIIIKFQIDMDKTASIFIGRDTRPSSKSLSDIVVEGVEALGGVVTDYGVVTTPMLHYLVTCHNTGGSYGRPTHEGYFDKLAVAFKALRAEGCRRGNYKPELEFDGANGVGALKMAELLRYLSDCLYTNIHNSDTTSKGKLNHLCGADHVKTSQTPPTGVPLRSFARCASVDGDADRLVYYFIDDNSAFHLLDGDRIAILIAGYLKELTEEAGLNLQIGLVQTAYANGSSTEYITDKLKLQVACVPTGVKHLHHKALEFDIGVYFEANGHGTVVYSENAKQKIKKATKDTGLSDTAVAAAEKLAYIVDMTNETVGDALSDLLLVETVLHSRGWDIQDWLHMYTDLPYRLVKVKVKDRTVITTTDAARRCVTPVGLQEEIDKFISDHPKGRSFVRPSGTEDVVRVYAEADTSEHAEALSQAVAEAVKRLAGGL
ncbi:phosphoacetylglucosamine mutase [Macrosteles quadrilineatus]|uniref:phosphoacetylglucosamine mutase n=1 Tax=Macrosteles quadrilineatus TaxID=74068 RepID=UPI0023E100DD|nr:phosphoacetylglucosamine mutase [Macrosteles quadrilineatus]